MSDDKRGSEVGLQDSQVGFLTHIGHFAVVAQRRNRRTATRLWHTVGQIVEPWIYGGATTRRMALISRIPPIEELPKCAESPLGASFFVSGQDVADKEKRACRMQPWRAGGPRSLRQLLPLREDSAGWRGSQAGPFRTT